MDKVDLSYIEYCADMQGIINKLQSSIDKAMKPVLKDDRLIPVLHERMQELMPETSRSVSIRAELMVFLFLYDPMRLYIGGSQTKNHYDIQHVCDALGITRNNFSKYKKGLLIHYRLYKSFRHIVNELVRECINLSAIHEIDGA